jgi:undecaprenyl diphosphate synthase
MNIPESIDRNRIPGHIAIIMDGNGRWAKERGEDRVQGHYEGVVSVREVVDICGAIGVRYLTLYAFSAENWNRPKEEVDALMELLVNTIRKEVDELKKNNVRMHVIGDFESLPESCRIELNEAIEITADNTGLNLILALSYSSRDEIALAAKKIAAKVAAGTMKVEDINDDTLSAHLYTAAFPDPELMIRTSGECRISNFLLYQLAYSELYFTNVHWPDFRKQHLLEAIQNYQQRERRFGKTSEQIQTIKPEHVQGNEE